MLEHYLHRQVNQSAKYAQGGFYILNKASLSRILPCIHKLNATTPFNKRNLVSEDSLLGVCSFDTNIPVRSSRLVSPFNLPHPLCKDKVSIHLVKNKYVTRFSNCTSFEKKTKNSDAHHFEKVTIY